MFQRALQCCPDCSTDCTLSGAIQLLQSVLGTVSHEFCLYRKCDHYAALPRWCPLLSKQRRSVRWIARAAVLVVLVISRARAMMIPWDCHQQFSGEEGSRTCVLAAPQLLFQLPRTRPRHTAVARLRFLRCLFKSSSLGVEATGTSHLARLPGGLPTSEPRDLPCTSRWTMHHMHASHRSIRFGSEKNQSSGCPTTRQTLV